MSESSDLALALLAALETVPGLVPAVPKRASVVSAMPLHWDALAVDVGAETVEIRVIGTALPLPPLLRRAETVLRAELSATPWSTAALRLVVTDLDACAFECHTIVACDFRSGGEDHPIGS